MEKASIKAKQAFGGILSFYNKMGRRAILVALYRSIDLRYQSILLYGAELWGADPMVHSKTEKTSNYF